MCHEVWLTGMVEEIRLIHGFQPEIRHVIRTILEGAEITHHVLCLLRCVYRVEFFDRNAEGPLAALAVFERGGAFRHPAYSDDPDPVLRYADPAVHVGERAEELLLVHEVIFYYDSFYTRKPMNGDTTTDHKRRFLFVSYENCASDIAWQVAKEGNEVKFYIASKDDQDVGEGFFEKVQDWKAEVAWADVIVFDDVFGFGNSASQLRKQGKLVVGGTAYTDQLEIDRSFGQSELKRLGVPILNYQEFTDFDAGIQYVKEHPDAYVIKPSGAAQNQKQLLFVGQEDDGADVVRTLEAYKKVWAKQIKVFQLQKKVLGVEIAVGAFFNGNRFITPINVNFEHKNLFPGNVGPPTGEMGTSMFWSSPNKLFNATLKKFEEKLAEEKYVGYIDLNCIVNGYGIYPLEFTARFGYPTIQIQQEGMMMPTGELLYMLASGADFELKTKKGFQVGVALVVAPYPYEDKRIFDAYSKDTTIVFKKPNQLEGVHISEVRMVNGEWVAAGFTGYLIVVVGTGQTMKQAQQQAYSRVQNILIPNMYYRTDIGDRWFEDSDKLHNWGYLRES